MSVIVTDVDSSEDRMEKLEKKVNMLMKVVEERDYEIASLKNHIESRDAAESTIYEEDRQSQNANGYQPPKFQQFDGKATQNNMLLTSSKLVKLLIREKIYWSNSSFEPSKKTSSTGTPISNPNPLIVGSSLRGTFSIAFIAPDVLSA
ncbi:ty3-gypsy retrotransposon protein [Cucumis melo var. makuwa]|uniref:Ty3-gypsy retrotransposon protein n=1 Tax=Cucumis melo var. makuwa TaxID=1194695 RepID=A0A5D3E509_CUCMM|nr:ty3-gypsy retrotransposon protein [Cucumis melo var. makuwa]TYK30949.1 ty3-gypsy retrotransposon protein [Cucumis melo var. makuwa]